MAKAVTAAMDTQDSAKKAEGPKEGFYAGQW